MQVRESGDKKINNQITVGTGGCAEVTEERWNNDRNKVSGGSMTRTVEKRRDDDVRVLSAC
jgi:hypothetical protein